MESPLKNGDSPSHQLFDEARRRVESQPPALDSPSRQLLYEFSRMMIDSDRRFHNQLDRAAAEQEAAHRDALAAAAAEHERVRLSAERVAEKFRLELEGERRRCEEQEHRELERIRQENARIEAEKRQRQMVDVRRREEEQRKAAEEAKALAEAEERLHARKAAEEVEAAKRKAEQEERERKAKEAAVAAVAAERTKPQQPVKPSTQAAAPPAQTNGATSAALTHTPSAVSSSPLVSAQAERDAIHQDYLEIHQRLKRFRKDYMAQIKMNQQLKDTSSALRRGVRTRLGQLTQNAKENREPLRHIRELFSTALTTPCFAVDVKQFLAKSTQDQLPHGPFTMSALLIFVFNHFSKTVINQFASEAGVKPRAADPIGIIAVSIFGNPEYCINQRIPLTDILLAKYHKSCGVLFGIYGHEKTKLGRTRLGWHRTGDDEWIPEQAHLERMTGLGAGWASLSLRKIKVGSSLIHPLPNAHYWRAFSRIVNTPPHEATATHFMVLKALVEGDSVPRFVMCYGKAAIAALRKGLLDFPRGQASIAAKSIEVVAEEIKKTHMLTL